MYKSIIALLLCGCGVVSINRPESPGPRRRLPGSQVTVVNDGIDQIMLGGAIASINEQVGCMVLTIASGKESTIYVDEGILPYDHGDFEEVLNGPSGISRSIDYQLDEHKESVLGRATQTGNQCQVVINYFVPGPRVRYNDLKHELLHCLGLQDSREWRDVMNGDMRDLRHIVIMEDDRAYLNDTYCKSEK